MDMRYLKYVLPGKKYYQPQIERVEESKLNVPFIAEGWQKNSDDHWSYYFKSNIILPLQGWKIHISSTSKAAQKTLDVVSTFLFEESVTFKHVSNVWELIYKNSKYGHRGSSGKFITIYPANEDQFISLVTKLHDLLKGMPKGPYILSDKRWLDGNVYFRYGAFGEMYFFEGASKIPAIQTPSGEYVPDSREAYYVVPSFVEEPKAVQDMTLRQEAKQVESSKLNSYEIKSALHFSNGGGVYLANQKDSGEQIVLKEGRPGAGLDGQGRDAVERLKHEAKILKQLKGLKYVVQFKDTFQAWEHTFLAEEYVPGAPLHNWLAAYYPFSTQEDSKGYCKKVIHILKQIKNALVELHSRGIGMGDLQPANIMVTTTDDVKLIDFESASDITDAKHSGLMTPGFTGAFDITREQSDWFALSRIARQVFVPIGPVQDMAESILLKHNQWIVNTFGEEALAIVKEMEDECTKRSAKPIESVLSSPCQYFAKRDLPELISKIREGIVNDLSDGERLLPGDIRQFETTNGLWNVLTGGYGVIMALSRTGSLPTKARDWTMKYSKDEYINTLDDGLFTGKAGVAGVLYEIGMVSEAEKIYDSLATNLETEDISLITGLAGTGLALLSASTVLEKNTYMRKTIDIAGRLETLLEQDVYIKPSDVDFIPIGLIDGWSGVSLFYSALYRITDDPHWLSLSERAIVKDLNQCKLEDSGLYQVKDGSRFVPYLAGGSAGIGLALILLRHLQGNKNWEKELHGIGLLSKSKCFYSSGLFRGLGGLIVVANAIDTELQIQKDSHVDKALETINLYLLEDDGKYYLPGDYDYRLSGDIFSGASGMVLALNDIGSKEWFSWLPVPNVSMLLSTNSNIGQALIY